MGRGEEWREKGGVGRGKERSGGVGREGEHTQRSNYSCSEVAPGGMYSLTQ